MPETTSSSIIRSLASMETYEPISEDDGNSGEQQADAIATMNDLILKARAATKLARAATKVSFEERERKSHALLKSFIEEVLAIDRGVNVLLEAAVQADHSTGLLHANLVRRLGNIVQDHAVRLGLLRGVQRDLEMNAGGMP